MHSTGIFAAVVLSLFLTSASFAEIRYRSVSATEPVVGRYVVTLADGLDADVAVPVLQRTALAQANPDEFKWDALGMMTELRWLNTERYVYDANDERVVRIQLTNGTETSRRYSLRRIDNKVVRDLTYAPASGTWSFEKDYVYRGSTLVASFNSASTTAKPDTHYHVDHLGSTRLVTDTNGFRRALTTYWPFGREAEGSDPDAERMKYTGHERDTNGLTPGHDLDYMHARYYNASTGRFLSIDPARENYSRAAPQTFNRYTYVLNNPVGAIDPTGRWTVSISVGGFGAFGLAGSAKISFNVDNRFNWSVTKSSAWGGGSPALEASLAAGYNWRADTVYDLAGDGDLNVGGGAGIVVPVGAELGISEEGGPSSVELSVGVGADVPVDIHAVIESTSEPLASGNPIDDIVVPLYYWMAEPVLDFMRMMNQEPDEFEGEVVRETIDPSEHKSNGS